MTLLEAIVWIVGILTAGITIRYTVGAFATAGKVLEEIRWDFRKIIENQDEARHDRQMEWEKNNDRESDAQNR